MSETPAELAQRELLWLSLPDQRPRRELYWLSQMPQTHVTALAAQEPVGEMTWVPGTYRRPVKRFIEAGALAWSTNLDRSLTDHHGWVASLELCSLVTGQLSKRSRRRNDIRQAVLTWENLPYQPLYSVPGYRQAFESCRDADLILCMVDAARIHLDRRGFNLDRVRVVKPGIDVETFAPADSLSDAPRVVFTSPLAANKGIDTVLEAMKLVRHAIPDAELVVAGQGPLRELVTEHEKLYPNHVKHVGNLDAAGVGDLLRSAAVFTTAPRPTWKWTEQLGLAYLEAQACGLPVVTTACGTNDEAVLAPNVMCENDAGALAEGLIHFLNNRSEAQRVGQINAERMRAEHDIRIQTRRLGEAFAEFE